VTEPPRTPYYGYQPQGYPPVPPVPEQQAAVPSPYSDPWSRPYPAQPPGYQYPPPPG
jgi:hypothetical protein